MGEFLSNFLSFLPILKQLADIWATLSAFALAGICLCVAAYIFPVARQMLIGLALGCFLATAVFAWGVKQERDVGIAREERAEAVRVERDKLQARIAHDDEARAQAGLNDFNRKEDEDESAYETRLAQRKPDAGACTLSVDDLR